MSCSCQPFKQDLDCVVHPSTLRATQQPDERVGLPQLMQSGITFWPLDPRPEEVLLDDVVVHLSNLCRFTGATEDSVGQHSCHVHDRLFDEYRSYALAAWGLLHDATETYAGDVARPLKYAIEGFGEKYREVEHRIEAVVAERFGLRGTEVPHIVKLVDDRMLATELRDLMPRTSDPRFDPSEFAEPYPEPIEVWSHDRTRYEFRRRFDNLCAAGVVTR